MLSLKLIITASVLCLLLQVHANGIKSFEKQWIFQEKEVILSRDQSSSEVNNKRENRLLYALCEEAHWKSKKICDVIVETYTSENLTYKSVCKLHLETQKESRMIGRNFILAHLGSGKALFAWLDREKAKWGEHEILLKIRVINWTNCEYNDVKIPIEMQNEMVDEIAFSNILAYDNCTFDVFFYSKTLCDTGRCKMTFDAKGKRIGRAESFLPKEQNSSLSTVLPVSSTISKGYYAFSWTSEKFTATLVNPEGDAVNLLGASFKGYIVFDISNLHEIFGICWLPMRGDTMVTCTQMDSLGNTKLNVTLNFGYQIVRVKMHNLAEGGFLLLQLVCTDQECLGYKAFHVSKIFPDGHHDNRPLEISGIDLDISILDRYRISLFQRNDTEFCMTFTGPATLSEFDIIVKEPRMNYVSKCFHKQHVSVK